MQIQGATVGDPDSASVTDIFGARFIDTVLGTGAHLSPDIGDVTEIMLLGHRVGRKC